MAAKKPAKAPEAEAADVAKSPEAEERPSALITLDETIYGPVTGRPGAQIKLAVPGQRMTAAQLADLRRKGEAVSTPADPTPS